METSESGLKRKRIHVQIYFRLQASFSCSVSVCVNEVLFCIDGAPQDASMLVCSGGLLMHLICLTCNQVLFRLLIAFIALLSLAILNE